MIDATDGSKIIVAACKDECTLKLSSKVKQFFVDMGSGEISNLGERQSFAFIGTLGKKDAVEKRG